MGLFFSRKVLNSVTEETHRGLIQLERSFSQMAESHHSKKIFVSEIQTAIEALSAVLDETICRKGGNSRLISQTESIEQAIEFISNAISNRLQASRFLYDTKFYNVKSIGPFSDVYLFYEKLIDLFEALLKIYLPDGSSDSKVTNYKFLLDISVSSVIVAEHFIPDTCEVSPSYKLVGIHINEYTFLQIVKTIVYLLHEIGHHVQPYSRQERNQLFLDLYIWWLGDHMYEEMRALLYEGLGTGPDAREVDVLGEHFEIEVFDVIGGVLEYSLLNFFSKFADKSRSNGTSYLELPLEEFKEFIEFGTEEISQELNDLLLIGTAEEKDKTFLIREALIEELRSKPNSNPEKSYVIPAAFDNLSIKSVFELASLVSLDLLSDGNEFGYIPGKGNATKNENLELYLKGISLFGLGEVNDKNQHHLSDQLLQILKKAVDASISSGVVEFIFVMLDEALADLFIIRALDINTYDEYWTIFKDLFVPDKYSKEDVYRYFSGRNAILTEYFERKSGIKPGTTKLAIPLTYPAKTQTADLDQIARKEQFYSPVAEYLASESIYPEDKFFQIGQRSNDLGQAVLALREKFHELISNSGNVFSKELDMIEALSKFHFS